MEENKKAKFLYDLGIRKDNYPTSFLEKIEDISKMLSTTEIGYCACKQFCDGKAEKFCIKDVVGTDHQRYTGKTWIDAFLDLDRGDNIIELYNENPDYWQEMKNPDNADIGLIKYGDKYYIFDHAGGGNNRVITMKMRYLALLEQAGNDSDEIEKLNNEFSFYAKVRELPKDKSIPFVIMALAEDLDEFSVRKEQENYIVTNAFQNEELFRGNDDEIKEYFKGLFDTRNNSQEIIDSRLDSLRLAIGWAGKEYKEIIESIIPQLKKNSTLKERDINDSVQELKDLPQSNIPNDVKLKLESFIETMKRSGIVGDKFGQVLDAIYETKFFGDEIEKSYLERKTEIDGQKHSQKMLLMKTKEATQNGGAEKLYLIDTSTLKMTEPTSQMIIDELNSGNLTYISISDKHKIKDEEKQNDTVK